MNHAFVDPVKNLSTVTEDYKFQISKTTNAIKINPLKDASKKIFDFKTLYIIFFLIINLLKSSVLVIKPSFLPILRNLFFLSINISSEVN